MPNWFYFTVNVSGEEKDVEQFVENVKGSEKYETEGREFDFNHFIPQPDNIFRGNLGDKEEKMCEEQGIPNWYRWNNQNWGTKWNGVERSGAYPSFICRERLCVCPLKSCT